MDFLLCHIDIEDRITLIKKWVWSLREGFNWVIELRTKRFTLLGCKIRGVYILFIVRWHGDLYRDRRVGVQSIIITHWPLLTSFFQNVNLAVIHLAKKRLSHLTQHLRIQCFSRPHRLFIDQVECKEQLFPTDFFLVSNAFVPI